MHSPMHCNTWETSPFVPLFQHTNIPQRCSYTWSGAFPAIGHTRTIRSALSGNGK